MINTCIGINAFFSGSYNIFAFAEATYKFLLPVLVDYLSSVPPQLGFPPNPDTYTGDYSSATAETVSVLSQDKVMYIRYGGATYYLDYQMENRMQVVYV